MKMVSNEDFQGGTNSLTQVEDLKDLLNREFQCILAALWSHVTSSMVGLILPILQNNVKENVYTVLDNEYNN